MERTALTPADPADVSGMAEAGWVAPPGIDRRRAVRWHRAMPTGPGENPSLLSWLGLRAT